MSKKKKVLILFSMYVFSVVFLCIFWMSGKIFLDERKPENLKTSTIDYNNLPVVLENSFRIVVNGLDGNPGLVVNFNEGLTSAKVKMYQSALEVNNGVYIEIDQESPYSQIMLETGYKIEHKYFEYTKPEYTIDIPDGAEVKYKQATLDNKIKLISNLTNEEITEYQYGTDYSGFFNVSNGYFISRNTYNECEEEGASCIRLADAQNIMNGVLRSYVTPILDDYFANVSDTELNNRTINLTVKNKLINYYERLSDADKGPYTERINKLRSGGSPVITYSGFEQYNLNSNVDLNSLITINDSEDGNIAITSTNVIVTSNLNTTVLGTYNISIQVTDSDSNVSTKNITIRIVDPGTTSSSTTSSTTSSSTSSSTTSTSSTSTTISTTSSTTTTSTTTTSSTTRQALTHDASPRTDEEDEDDEEETTQSTTRTNQVSGNYNTGTLPRSYSSSRNNSSNNNENNNENNNTNNNTNNNEVLRNVLLTVGSLTIAAALAFTSYQLFFKD